MSNYSLDLQNYSKFAWVYYFLKISLKVKSDKFMKLSLKKDVMVLILNFINSNEEAKLMF